MRSDPRLRFDEVSHRYWCEDKELVSVTTLVNKFKPPFDRERWSKHVALRDGKTVEEVLCEWDHSRDWSCAVGTLVHSLCEEMVYASPERLLGMDLGDGVGRHAVEFFSDHPEIADGSRADAEIMVCDPEFGLAGTIDLFCSLGGKTTILDWKTNKKIDKSGYGKMLPPIQHMPDCNFSVYSLQLNLYRRILASYGEEVERMALVHLREDGYKVYDVPVLEKEVCLILSTITDTL